MSPDLVDLINTFEFLSLGAMTLAVTNTISYMRTMHEMRRKNLPSYLEDELESYKHEQKIVRQRKNSSHHRDEEKEPVKRSVFNPFTSIGQVFAYWKAAQDTPDKDTYSLPLRRLLTIPASLALSLTVLGTCISTRADPLYLASIQKLDVERRVHTTLESVKSNIYKIGAIDTLLLGVFSDRNADINRSITWENSPYLKCKELGSSDKDAKFIDKELCNQTDWAFMQCKPEDLKDVINYIHEMRESTGSTGTSLSNLKAYGDEPYFSWTDYILLSGHVPLKFNINDSLRIPNRTNIALPQVPPAVLSEFIQFPNLYQKKGNPFFPRGNSIAAYLAMYVEPGHQSTVPPSEPSYQTALNEAKELLAITYPDGFPILSDHGSLLQYKAATFNSHGHCTLDAVENLKACMTSLSAEFMQSMTTTTSARYQSSLHHQMFTKILDMTIHKAETISHP